MGVRGVVCEIGSVVCVPAERVEGGERSESLLALLRATGVEGFSRSPWGEEELRGISHAPILNYHPLSLLEKCSKSSSLHAATFRSQEGFAERLEAKSLL